MLRTPKHEDQLATGGGLPAGLAPGSYVIEAASHLMSDEPSPGVGHQHETGLAGTCSSELEVTLEIGLIQAGPEFGGVGCSVYFSTWTDYPDTEMPLDVNASVGEDCGSIGGCAHVLELTGPRAGRAELRSTGGHADMEVGPGLPGSLQTGLYSVRAWIHFMSDDIGNGVRSSVRSEFCTLDFRVLGGERRVTLDVHFDAASCTIEVAFDRPGSPTQPVEEPEPSAGTAEPEITCFFGEPATTCEQYIEAALEALGPDHPPIREILVHNICVLPYPPPDSCGATVVQITFPAQRGFEPAELVVSFSITPGPNGLVATMLGTFPGQLPAD